MRASLFASVGTSSGASASKADCSSSATSGLAAARGGDSSAAPRPWRCGSAQRRQRPAMLHAAQEKPSHRSRMDPHAEQSLPPATAPPAGRHGVVGEFCGGSTTRRTGVRGDVLSRVSERVGVGMGVSISRPRFRESLNALMSRSRRGRTAKRPRPERLRDRSIDESTSPSPPESCEARSIFPASTRLLARMHLDVSAYSGLSGAPP
mmetsp:Transcript_13891/g.41468  ORF Transcript_13891/g.41468 Transcript_13891/m.41468 type:complete len:207 (+) Transcript_13891:68-688(+)